MGLLVLIGCNDVLAEKWSFTSRPNIAVRLSGKVHHCCTNIPETQLTGTTAVLLMCESQRDPSHCIGACMVCAACNWCQQTARKSIKYRTVHLFRGRLEIIFPIISHCTCDVSRYQRPRLDRSFYRCFSHTSTGFQIT